MASRNDIRKAILAVTGAPSSGVFADVERIVDAVAALDEPKVTRRIVEAQETR